MKLRLIIKKKILLYNRSPLLAQLVEHLTVVVFTLVIYSYQMVVGSIPTERIFIFRII